MINKDNHREKSRETQFHKAEIDVNEVECLKEI